MIDLEYDPTSFTGPVDMAFVSRLENYRHLKLDPAYLQHAQRYHGGIPGKQYFDAANGETYRLGRFLTLVDEKSELSPPFMKSWEHHHRDIRIDWSVITVMDQEGPSCRGLFDALLPFAALYRGE